MKENANLDRSSELEAFKIKLWNRVVAVGSACDASNTFDRIWYEFLTNRFIFEDISTESLFEGFCTELEQKINTGHFMNEKLQA
ncbi:hypothetical protein E0485_10795 [Paenibacillus albiflavus]|uniref:Uncharacterized protein n=1 Tax=Paenibacillus albiflavus TaxID=2545760 RepID=A0A4R4EGT2_9BACL|nr:hypothetical protein [Paenibacillus albiflavus]TCZ77471.1 hypothetical protein E0485_10795 [Paenibacillus albiflavus]